jgi:hypothetical protein
MQGRLTNTRGNSLAALSSHALSAWVSNLPGTWDLFPAVQPDEFDARLQNKRSSAPIRPLSLEAGAGLLSAYFSASGRARGVCVMGFESPRRNSPRRSG